MERTLDQSQPGKTLAVFFSKGAFGDCARLSILAAMDDERVNKIKVYSAASTISTLHEANWKSEIKGNVDRGKELKESPNRHKVELIPFPDHSLTGSANEEFEKIVDLSGVDAVISGLGNRQIFLGDRVGTCGTKKITSLMKEKKVDRLVMMSSMGISSDISNDKPSMEWRWEGKIMDCIFSTISRREYNDLVGAENEAKKSGLNYLVLRPVGLGEEVAPVGELFLQKEKHEDVLGPQISKMDVGAFMVEQALDPTLEKRAVVIGGNPKDAHLPM